MFSAQISTNDILFIDPTYLPLFTAFVMMPTAENNLTQLVPNNVAVYAGSNEHSVYYRRLQLSVSCEMKERLFEVTTNHRR